MTSGTRWQSCPLAHLLTEATDSPSLPGPAKASSPASSLLLNQGCSTFLQHRSSLWVFQQLVVFQHLGSRPGKVPICISFYWPSLSTSVARHSNTDADPQTHWVYGEEAVEHRCLGGIPPGAGNIGVFGLPLFLAQ